MPQTQHAYVYVANNPINLTDPSGEIAPILIAAGVGAAIGAVGGGVGYVLANPGGRPEDYIRSGGFWQSVGIGAASGAMAGVVGWAVPMLLPTAGNAWGAMGIWGLSGALAGGAGQFTYNALMPCRNLTDDLGWAMLGGGVTGVAFGGVGWKMGWIAKAAPNPNAIGKAGEKAVGITGSKTRIASTLGTAKYRVPDKLDPIAKNFKRSQKCK